MIKKKIKKIIKGILGIFISIFSAFVNLGLIIRTLCKGKRVKNAKETTIEEVCLVCNGPSAKDVDLIKLKGKVVGCLNYFAIKNDSFWDIKPSYYFLIDPLFFARIKDREVEMIEQLFEVFEKIDWDITLVTPQGLEFKTSNKHIKFQHIARIEKPLKKSKNQTQWLYKHNFCNCGLRNVAVAALFYFSLIKVKTVYVLGLDMNEFMQYNIDINNNVWSVYKHFYGVETVNQTEAGAIQKGDFSTFLGYYVKMFVEFSYVSQFATKQNVKIYNMCPTSYVDVFDKLEVPTKWK